MRPRPRYRDLLAGGSEAGRGGELATLLEHLTLPPDVLLCVHPFRDHLLATEDFLVIVQPGGQRLERVRLTYPYGGQQQLPGQIIATTQSGGILGDVSGPAPHDQ